MFVSEDALIRSGFTATELHKIKSNVEIYGGTLEEAIHDLARRFGRMIWIVGAFMAIFIILVLFSSGIKIIAGGISFLIGIGFLALAQPPVLCFKSWRYKRSVQS